MKQTVNYTLMDSLLAGMIETNERIPSTMIAKQVGCSVERVSNRIRVLREGEGRYRVKNGTPGNPLGECNYNYAVEVEKDFRLMWAMDFQGKDYGEFKKWLATKQGSEYLDAKMRERMI